MGISFLLTREYKHLAPPCLHGEEFQSDKRRQLVTYGKPLPAGHPLATIPPGDSEPALTEPTSPEATREHATDEPAALLALLRPRQTPGARLPHSTRVILARISGV